MFTVRKKAHNRCSIKATQCANIIITKLNSRDLTWIRGPPLSDSISLYQTSSWKPWCLVWTLTTQLQHPMCWLSTRISTVTLTLIWFCLMWGLKWHQNNDEELQLLTGLLCLDIKCKNNNNWGRYVDFSKGLSVLKESVNGKDYKQFCNHLLC